MKHPWLAHGRQYCCGQLESTELPERAHALAEALMFLDHNPERERADRLAQAVAAGLPPDPQFHRDPQDPGYGLTPLHLAPTPEGRWRRLLADGQSGARLDCLPATQEADGGWLISWEPPSESATLEWRGMETLRALHTLTAFGRLST
ncbi:MAG TPA: hypothetical protein VNF24_03730 [Candidatus Acidoferrales bacterium]|nr:hypothetical protein [Candidatus Acidoferrales bacterium]